LTSRPSKKPFSTAVGDPIDSLWMNQASKTVTFVLAWARAAGRSLPAGRPAKTSTSARARSRSDRIIVVSSLIG